MRYKSVWFKFIAVVSKIPVLYNRNLPSFEMKPDAYPAFLPSHWMNKNFSNHVNGIVWESECCHNETLTVCLLLGGLSPLE